MMYVVNKDQIEIRLAYLTKVEHSLRLLCEDVQENKAIRQLARERAIHIAAECVTDIGNYMIDGFVMRDAASYVDIIDILFAEQVFTEEVFKVISALVKMRKPLVQNYHELNADEVNELASILPDGLAAFADSVIQYVTTEYMVNN